MKILWIAGWASSFEMWKTTIEEMFDAEHTYISPHQEVNISDRFDLVVCWSLGLHHLPKNLQTTKVLMVNPAIDFCNTKGGVHPKILNRMIKQIASFPEEVLKNFAVNCGFENSEIETWVKQALDISTDKLIVGLNQLKEVCTLDSRYQYALLQASADNIVSADFNKEKAKTSESIISSKEYLGSHLVNFNEVKIYLEELNWI